MQNAFIAIQPQQNIKPAFTVREIKDRTVTTYQHIFDKKENKIKRKKVEEPYGFLVTFAKGHSIRCKDIEHLRRIGAGYNVVPVVNTETGDVVGGIQNLDSILDDAAGDEVSE